MPTQITISTLSGVSPFDVYTCDTGYTTCVYVSTITSGDVPYTFFVPPIMEGMPSYGIKVVDSTNCNILENIS